MSKEGFSADAEWLNKHKDLYIKCDKCGDPMAGIKAPVVGIDTHWDIRKTCSPCGGEHIRNKEKAAA